jgi:hypothetical protein
VPQACQCPYPGSMGARPDARARSLPCHVPCSSRGGSGAGPGRGNSLASLGSSLTDSLSLTARTGATRPGGSDHSGLKRVTAFGFSTAAAGVPAR